MLRSLKGLVDPRPARRIGPPRLLGLLLGIVAAAAVGLVVLIALGLLLVIAGVHILSVHETHVITLLASAASFVTLAGVAAWWVSTSLSRRPRPTGRRLAAGGAVIAIGVACILAGTTYVYGSALASAPENERPPAVTGLVHVGSILRADPGRWEPSDVELTYRRKRCGLAARNCRSILGAQQETYRVRSADVGRRLQLAVVGRNDAGTTIVAAEPTGVVGR